MVSWEVMKAKKRISSSISVKFIFTLSHTLLSWTSKEIHFQIDFNAQYYSQFYSQYYSNKVSFLYLSNETLLYLYSHSPSILFSFT